MTARAATDDFESIDTRLDYFGLRFPISEHYELVDWRRADAELNYRRFFAVNSLAAIRVELPWVFDESHVEIVRWVREGLVDGIRVDHPDGLLDPGGYLDDLARATDSTYVLVEKILEGDEQLPPHWQAAGTTGYDALGDIDRVLVDPERAHAARRGRRRAVVGGAHPLDAARHRERHPALGGAAHRATACG